MEAICLTLLKAQIDFSIVPETLMDK